MMLVTEVEHRKSCLCVDKNSALPKKGGLRRRADCALASNSVLVRKFVDAAAGHPQRRLELGGVLNWMTPVFGRTSDRRGGRAGAARD